ncbi:MAG: RNA polymerase sigma factor, partial [Bacteroidota bacterium]
MAVPPDDQDLLEQLHDPRRRDRAFTVLTQVYGPLLHRHLLRMLHVGADVDDVLQNTFVKVYRNVAGFRGESKLSTWLYRIATNEALSWLRSQQRRRKRFTSEDPATLAASRLTADPYFDGDAAQLELQRALATLPDKQ